MAFLQLNRLPRASLLAVLGALLAGPVAAVDQATVSKRGAEILAPLKENLMAALKGSLAQGPEQAIDTCRIQAPAIAQSLSVDGVHVGRTSHRLRNPDNAGPEWAEEVLEHYLEEEGAPAPQVVGLEGGRVGYVEPILTQELCLTCHGKTVDESVAATIAELYPEDEATGFAVGDLRGVFWAEFPE